MTLRELAKAPDDVIDSVDDRAVKELIVDLGLSEKFREHPPGTKPTLDTVLVEDQETHFILVVRNSGHENPKDNGYLAVCLSKSKTSPAEFAAFVADFIEPSTGKVLRIEELPG
ncbi:MAG TPA: hypothetical protein VGF13_21205, partial [Verrucomicrobiae bacterium]